MKTYLPLAFAAAMLAGCATSSPVGLVNVQRIVSNWPEYQTYQTQLLDDERKLAQSKANRAAKRIQAIALQKKYAKITDQLTSQIRDAATKIAQQRQLSLVLTREGVGYGGVDITRDVEKALNVTEKATPTPGT